MANFDDNDYCTYSALHTDTPLCVLTSPTTPATPFNNNVVPQTSAVVPRNHQGWENINTA